jgi:hypothetical protein
MWTEIAASAIQQLIGVMFTSIMKAHWQKTASPVTNQMLLISITQANVLPAIPHERGVRLILIIMLQMQWIVFTATPMMPHQIIMPGNVQNAIPLMLGVVLNLSTKD